MSFNTEILAVREIESESDFEQATRSSIALVEFFSSWCGTCERQKPVFEAVAEEYVDVAEFIRVDVDEFEELALRLRIDSLPGFLFFEDGEIVDQYSGFMSEEELSDLLIDHMI